MAVRCQAPPAGTSLDKPEANLHLTGEMSASEPAVKGIGVRLRAALAGGAGAATGLILVLFLISALFGGFQWATPWGLLSCRRPDRLMLWALLLAGLWQWLRQPGATSANVTADLPHRTMSGLLLLLFSAAIWLRFLYRAYEPCLFGRTTPTVAFVTIHLLFLFSTLAGWAAWRKLAATEGEFGAWIAGLFSVASPLWFHISWPMIAGYAAISLAWLAPVRRLSKGGGWLPLSGLIPLLLILLTRSGWAGKRWTDYLLSHAAPGLMIWPAVLGLAAWALTRRKERPWLAPVTGLAWWGLILGGARNELGLVGALLLVPLLAGLVAMALERLAGARPLPWRNVVMLCAAGLLMAYARNGLGRGIRSPFAPSPEEESAAPLPAVEEGRE